MKALTFKLKKEKIQGETEGMKKKSSNGIFPGTTVMLKAIMH